MSVLSFFGNRWPYTPARPAPGVTRIAVVGDSMAFGQGVPYAQTLSQRLAYHLNGARTDLWFEGVTFGIPGGCFVHALERAVEQALPAAPRFLVLTACSNDALMLRPEPDSADELGRSWPAFAPILSSRLGRFVDAARAAAPAVTVVLLYFDRRSIVGAHRPAEVLAAIAADHQVPFIDGSAALHGATLERVIVSPADHHLNAYAHDLVARHAARAFGPLLPPVDEDAPLAPWVRGALDLADALEAAGVPAAVAAAQARATLRSKWHDRRNRSRASLTDAYAAVTDTLEERQRAAWPDLYEEALGHHVCAQPVAERLDALETRLYGLSTLLSGLEHAVDSGTLGQPLDGLPMLAGPRLAATGETASATVRRLRRELATLTAQWLGSAAGAGKGHAVLRRADAVAAAFANCTTRLDVARATLNRRPQDHDIDTVVEALHRAADVFAEELAALWRAFTPALAATLLPEGTMPDATMRLEIPILAKPGPGQWSYRVGVDATVPEFREAHMACGTLIRDGVARVYSLDLPLALVCRVDLTLFGVDLHVAGKDALSVRPARLVYPSGHAVTQDAPHAVQVNPQTIQLSYSAVSPFERCA